MKDKVTRAQAQMISQNACAEQSRRKKYEQKQRERSRNLNSVPPVRVKKV